LDLFVYGTLMVPKVMRTVCGYERDGEPALLHDYCRRRVAGEVYPAIFASVGDAVGGVVYRGVTTAQLSTLDSFEGPMYRRELVTVAVGMRAESASAYVLAPGLRHALSDDGWSLERFLADGLDAFLAGYRGFAGASNRDRRRERP
jgi:gamma-glutamylcyclotransferase (GGCT)/AIG2-like uncharacterized protein YtfP